MASCTIALAHCRDCLIHFSFGDIVRAIKNIARSIAAYLLTTAFPDHALNTDINTGEWQPLNLEAASLYFPPLQRVILEGLNLITRTRA
jgi:hypothetical protein